ncbi:DUF6318 family protein [Glutamicibacter sp. AOP5-A2-18]|uniref:DUF6318 family protein n=1 Tax=Glutamicibacter sp. AOP5-A2-18 TaxID=3457656 RepID=UPI00403365AC
MNLRIYVAAIIALTLTLTACSSAPSDMPTTSGSTSQTADSSKSASVPSKSSNQKSTSFVPASADGPAKNVAIPKLPKQARANSQQGATSFAKFYYELVNYTIDTSDATEIKKYTTRACEVCGNSIIDPADRSKKKGKWHVGGKHHPIVLDSYISGKDLAVVTVEYTADAIKSYAKPNKPLSSSPSLEATRVSMGLEFKDGWKVYRIVGVS